jgi:hypothetical protein
MKGLRMGEWLGKEGKEKAVSTSNMCSGVHHFIISQTIKAQIDD